MIYMRRNSIGGINVRHNQSYVDENSNYDDLWERLVTITDVHSGYEFAFDEVNETIYWTQIKRFLPDGTPVVRFDQKCESIRTMICVLFFFLFKNISVRNSSN